MKEGKPLAKDLCFVVRLDPQSLPCVERSETFIQFAQDIFVHGITSSKIGWIFQGSIRLCQTLQSITFSWRNTLCKGRMPRAIGLGRRIKEQTPQSTISSAATRVCGDETQ